MKPSKLKTTTFYVGAENSESASKKVSVLSTALPKAKKKSSKFLHENESMILAPPPAAESMLKHAIAIPSVKAENTLDDEQIIRKVTKHLKEISTALEKAYGFTSEEEQLGEKVSKPEGEEIVPSGGEDMTSFLLLCSSLAKQLEEAVKEEQQILESLFKWFQKEVYHVEELVTEQNVSDWELPLPDKAVSASIAQMIARMKKLEQLRNHLRTMPTVTERVVVVKSKKESLTDATPIYEEVKKMIEAFAAHFENDEFIGSIMEIADNVFLPQPVHSLNLHFQELFRIFEKQGTKLHQIMSELESLEIKYKSIQSDFDVMSEERMILENELKKIKGPEKTEQLLQREKTIMELQRKKTSSFSKFGEPDSSLKRPSFILSSADAAKLKEELFQTQKLVGSLEAENKVLQEQLKDALQEVEKSKKELEASAQTRKRSVTIDENISKKGKKGKKGKGDSKGDKRPSVVQDTKDTNTKTTEERNQVLQVENIQSTSLMSFGIKLNVKATPPERKTYVRIRHFPPLNEHFAGEKENKPSSKLQNQQERYFTPVTVPFIRKKEIYPGFMRVVNAWTISQPVPKMQDHKSPPGNIFIPKKPRRTTVQKKNQMM